MWRPSSHYVDASHRRRTPDCSSRGIVLTLRQLRENSKTQQATFFKELHSAFYADQKIRNAYYLIEYDNFKYDASFHGAELERDIDQLLKFADMVCNLHKEGLLNTRAMSLFNYEFLRVYSNESIQRYLGFLRTWYSQVKSDTEPFPHFIDYCRKARTSSPS
jgi:hypothetical protein